MGQLKPFPISDLDTPEASPSPANNRPKKSGLGKWLLIIGILLIIAAGAGGGYWYKTHKLKTVQPKSTTASQGPTVTPPSSSSTTGNYVSNGKDLNLNFKYPADWTVTPTSGNNQNDQAIILNTPLFKFSDVSGNTVTGKVTVSIRPGSAKLSELASGNAQAAQASAQFAYDKPTSAQHQYPYLTFIHLSGGANPNNGFEEVIITGVTQFPKSQNISSFSLGQLDPIISAEFFKCDTQVCTGSGATPVSISNNTWQNTNVFKQVQSLFSSLQLN